MTTAQSPMDFYQVLGVPPSATLDEIRAAYRARISHYHPDRNASTHATAVAALLNEAWETLGNAERRRQYDDSLGFGAVGAGGNGDGSTPDESSTRSTDDPPSNDSATKSSPAPTPISTWFGFAFGWKIYILGFAWLGVVVGVISDSLTAALIFWMIGASAAWLLAPIVHRSGWPRIVAVTAVSITALYAIVQLLTTTSKDVVAGLVGWAVIFLVRRSKWMNTPIRLRRADDKTNRESAVNDRCPGCGCQKPWVRRPSDGLIACWRCGRAHVTPATDAVA
jgi:hypothetical protein